MPRPWWLRPLSPDFIAVPHEPSAAELPIADVQVDEPQLHTHIYCCDPDTALCGLDMTGGTNVPDEDPADCFACVVIDEVDVPCHARFCRLRSRWRMRRWFR